MKNLESVQNLLCDLFTKVYRVQVLDCFLLSNLKLLKKRLKIVSDWFWTSTTNASDTSNAWNVNFNNGNDNWNDKTNSNYVRCVRAGE